MQPHSLLDQQKRAAARSARCHDLAHLRTLQGCYGTAKFYQFEAARLHVRACELRDQMACVQPLPGLRILNVVIADYIPPVNPVTIDMSVYGSKPIRPGHIASLLINDCGAKRCRDLGCFGYCNATKAHNAAATLADYKPRFIGRIPHDPDYIVGERG